MKMKEIAIVIKDGEIIKTVIPEGTFLKIIDMDFDDGLVTVHRSNGSSTASVVTDEDIATYELEND